MKKVIIYTDGACSGNPGPGGWGAILEYKGTLKEMSGGDKLTTNNRMELMGAISALTALREPCEVELYTDSKYIVDAINCGWAEKWRANGWMRNRRDRAQNTDLWEELLYLLTQHKVEFFWVKGHDTNKYNNRCDELAVAQSRRYAEM